MHKTARLLLVGLGMLVLGTLPLAAQETKTPTPSLSATCRQTVEALAALTRDLPEPEQLWQENPVRSESDFDVNDYLSVLDHLTIQDGYVLDYVYYYSFMGGEPALYARPIDAEPFPNYEAYQSAQEKSPSEYLDYIVIDDTPEGYIQFAALWVMGEQFYLWWHANYNDTQILCDAESLEALLTSPNEFGDAIPDEVKREAYKLELEPVVDYLYPGGLAKGNSTNQATDINVSLPLRQIAGGKAARVQLILFTKWGGFLRGTFTIGRDVPRTLTVESETLIPYDCGVEF